jgi:ABC-type cobalamin/Fe3+-siderophores transport system ATPase subunit
MPKKTNTEAKKHSQSLKSIQVKKLKSIVNMEKIDFTLKRVTCLMGVNGSGKSSVLHALASSYKQEREYENDETDVFYIGYWLRKTKVDNWYDTKFEISYTYKIAASEYSKTEIFSKESKEQRWKPIYVRRESRPVFFIGIDSCVPLIERDKFAKMPSGSESLSTQIEGEIVSAINDILGIEIESLNSHTGGRLSYNSAKTRSNEVTYSSYLMGSGEQRVYRIVEILLRAPKNALILIDELELLMHVKALNQLLNWISEQAQKKDLQVVFTSHSPTIFDHQNKVQIYLLKKTPNKTLLLKPDNIDIFYELCGMVRDKWSVFVEDDLAKKIIEKILTEKKILKHFNVIKFGSCQNVYACVAAAALDGRIDKCLFVLDGDVDLNEDQKLRELQRVLTGQSQDVKDLRTKAIARIKEFKPSEKCKPELAMRGAIVKLDSEHSEHSEVFRYIFDNPICSDHTMYFPTMAETLSVSQELLRVQTIDLFAKTPEWSGYVDEVKAALKAMVPAG